MGSFRSAFIAVLLASALLVGAFLINRARPRVEVQQPTAQLVKATGKCAECHLKETPAMVHEYERSAHAAAGVNCLDCHQPSAGQQTLDHRGFIIATSLTAANCAACHSAEYQQYLRSRHAAPAWAAVGGTEGFTADQIAFAERYHPGAVERPAHALVAIEGPSAATSGCNACHDVGKPNADGSIGTCTKCHARHVSSVALARTPRTCGQCHMGPDHSQIEIYEESKHGVLFEAQQASMNLAAKPKKLTTQDMPVPTCATCHMSGLDGMGVTHDTTERLSYWLFAAVSEKRPTYAQGQAQMQQLCTRCHTLPRMQAFYQQAEAVIEQTNQRVKAATDLVDQLRKEGLLTPQPFDESVDFIYFDLWHYYGRTAKHGAFMGGPDFVQWHGNYEIAAKTVELQEIARELRAGHDPQQAAADAPQPAAPAP